MKTQTKSLKNKTTKKDQNLQKIQKKNIVDCHCLCMYVYAAVLLNLLLCIMATFKLYRFIKLAFFSESIEGKSREISLGTFSKFLIMYLGNTFLDL